MFVAGFIGSPAIDSVKGSIDAADGAPVFLAEDGLRWPVDPDAARAADSSPVVYGIRPEHFALASGDEGLPAHLTAIEPTGAETHVIATIGGTRVTAVMRERIAARPGETIRLAPNPGRTHLFHAESTLRLAY
jgi:multiple sugar transport system ATP-binding protein